METASRKETVAGSRKFTINPACWIEDIFKKGIQNSIIEQLVLFPSAPHDDLFDALDLAVKASKLRKKRRSEEPGLI